MNEVRMRRISPDQALEQPARNDRSGRSPSGPREPIDPQTLAEATRIVARVRDDGEPALRAYAEEFGERRALDPLVLGRDDLVAALDRVPHEERSLLERTAERIRTFARAQKDCLRDLDVPIPGGRAGHRILPIESAGCYAPGGRYPLPSSVLMTVIPARVAGVERVWVASPRPEPITLAAAAIAGADALLPIGGAHAIAALAYGVAVPGGIDIPSFDAIVGPGNRWVTAAKQIVSGRVAIDMLAGPTELCVLADSSADPARVAADLIAQAEHDVDARPILVTTSASLADRVDREVTRQLEGLPTAEVAARAFEGGFAVICDSVEEASGICDRIAPEHLALHLANAAAWSARLRNYGAIFIGDAAAEVLGDYGAGPNHVLPTGGTARFRGGLSVLTFLRVATWMRMDDRSAASGGTETSVASAAREASAASGPATTPAATADSPGQAAWNASTAATALLTDAAALARLERLEGHARAAEIRITCA